MAVQSGAFREIICTSGGLMHRRGKGRQVAARGIHHVDLAVADVDASLAFYRDLLGPLGLTEEVRYPTYRGTEEVVYLVDAHDRRGVGLRPADGGAHSYYDVGIEHLAFEVESRDEVDAAHERCLARGARIHFPRRRIATSITGKPILATTRSSSSTRTGCGSRCSAGREPISES